MKTIKCPSCGSEKITILENDKAVCLVCDSVFNVHNYSKEFEKATSHMDEKLGEMRDDIRQDISQVMKVNRSDREIEEFERLLEKAQTYIKLGDKPRAIESAQKATEIIPEKAKGYIEIYRLLTNNYTLTNCYETFLNTKKNKYEKIWSDAVIKASKCSDCDENFISEVVDFQKRCANRALSDIETDSQQANTFINEEKCKKNETITSFKNEQENKEKKLKRANMKTALVMSLFAVVLFALSKILDLEILIMVVIIVSAPFAFAIFSWKMEKKLSVFFGGLTVGTFIMAIIVSVAANFIDSGNIAVVEVICLIGVVFMIVKKINKKRDGIIRAIKANIYDQIKVVENKYNNNQKLFEERMQKLGKEKDLYNRILTDMQADNNGLKIIEKCINANYRI